MLEPTTVCRDKYGMWTHPALQDVSAQWDEETTPYRVESWFRRQGLTHHLVFMEDELLEHWLDGDLESCAQWQPEPEVENSFLVAIWDNEDGVAAMFASPVTHLKTAH